MIITNTEAARRQLCTAIRMFFADDDFVAVHTLACAASEIYETHCKTKGLSRTFDWVGISPRPKKELKELRDGLNRARNFFKHKHSLDRIEFDDTHNDFHLFSACVDCTTLIAPDEPLEVRAFLYWFFGVEALVDQAAIEADPAAVEARREQRARFDRAHPGVRMGSRREKKSFGVRLIQDAASGALVLPRFSWNTVPPGDN